MPRRDAGATILHTFTENAVHCIVFLSPRTLSEGVKKSASPLERSYVVARPASRRGGSAWPPASLRGLYHSFSDV